MDRWFGVTVSVLLLLCAGAMILSHLRAWRRLQERELDSKERDYRRRQLRRRVQTSALLGLAGVAILLGQWITAPPWVFAIWGIVLFLLGWMTVLAFADILATKYYYGRIRHQYLLEEVKLQAELRRLQGIRGNGKAGGKSRKGRGPGAKDKPQDKSSGE